MRECGIFKEMLHLGWSQCGVPCGCGRAAEDEAGEAHVHAVECLPTYTSILVILSPELRRISIF